MEREALRECVSACSKRPAVFVSKFRGALQDKPPDIRLNGVMDTILNFINQEDSVSPY